MSDPGRVLSLDLGEKRIGVALSDPLRMIARPLTVVKRSSRKADFEKYAKLIEEHGATLIVVGLPTYLNGDESAMTKWVRDYSAELATKISIPLILHDENKSSDDARQRMIDLGYNRRKRDALRDAAAAAIFLQDYLDLTQPTGSGLDPVGFTPASEAK